MIKENEHLHKVLEKSLGVPGAGLYKEKHDLASGRSITYNCSQAVGLASLYYLSAYRNQFGEPPPWLKTCHPSYRATLLSMAIKTRKLLPESIDQVSDYVQQYLEEMEEKKRNADLILEMEE